MKKKHEEFLNNNKEAEEEKKRKDEERKKRLEKEEEELKQKYKEKIRQIDYEAQEQLRINEEKRLKRMEEEKIWEEEMIKKRDEGVRELVEEEIEKQRIMEEERKRKKEEEEEMLRRREEGIRKLMEEEMERQRRNEEIRRKRREEEEKERRRKEEEFEKNNPKLIELIKKNIQEFEENGQKLTFENKIHILDRKINKCEIKEKIKLNIKIKNPNQSCKYEYSIYDDEDNLIKKSETKESKNEIILTDNFEMNYIFTKVQGIKIILIKHNNNNTNITIKKEISLQKIFKNENYEEKIDNLGDNEIISVGYDLPEEKKDDKYININFNVEDNNENYYDEDSNICYSIQKNGEILFQSPFCKKSNIIKTDILPISILKPQFEIFFYNKGYEKKKIITVKTDELTNGISETINLPNINNLHIKMKSEEVEKNGFIKLLKKGLNLNLNIAIDFTSSNGYPNNYSSLHYIKNGFINNYEKAIRETHKIMSIYNKNDSYNLYGFGAEVDNKFRECFNINGKDNPSIIGLENIISEYKKTVNKVIFSGGTYFSPVVNKISNKLKAHKNDNFNYHILLIISDGFIEDIKQTIDSIIESSKYPLSFIIIGIGGNVASDMKILNGENGKLISTNGEILNKDIVQYVHFNDYANNINKLTEAVLKYIPVQVCNYFKDKLKE